MKQEADVTLETYQTVIQSTSLADISFGFTEGSFLLLNGEKHLMSAAEDLTSNKQKTTKQIYQKWQRYGHYKTLKPISLNKS